MASGCTSQQISYELPSGANTNPLAPSDKSCNVFNPNGGNSYPCGSYLNVIVPTGPIPYLNTTTIALTPSGIYFKCAWDAFNRCQPNPSDDGLSFAGASKLCWKKNDGSDNGRDVGNFMFPLANSICSAACGTASANGTQGLGPHVMSDGFYVENDNSLSPYSGPCDQALTAHTCDCWP